MIPRLKVITRALDNRGAFGSTLAVAGALAKWSVERPHPKRTLFKWGNPPVMDEEWIDMAAQYDEIQLSQGAWEGKAEVQAQLIARNVDIEFGTYFNLHTLQTWMENAPPGSYQRSLWALLSCYPAVDCDGNEARIWNGNKWQPMWDIFNQSARLGACRILADYCAECGITSVFLDFASVPIACYDGGNWMRVDYLRNGISQCDDPGEQYELWRLWFDYMEELRDALPKNTSLLLNGNHAIRYDDFRDLVDAVFLEDFPAHHWDSWDEAVEDIPRLQDGGDTTVYLCNRQNDQRITDLAAEMGCVDARWGA